MDATRSIQHASAKTIRFFGTWTTLCLIVIVVLTTTAFIRAGSLTNTDNASLINDSGRQRMLVEAITKDALTIKIAMTDEDWNAIEPALTRLTANISDWTNTHSSLRVHSANAYMATDEIQTIFNHYERLNYSYTQIAQACAELTTVTQSVIRRAPFIDQVAYDRINTAINTITTHQSAFVDLMDEIVDHYESYSAEISSNATSSIRQSILFIAISIVAAIFLGVAPRLWTRACTIKQLQKDIKAAQESIESNRKTIKQLSHEFQTPISLITEFSSMISKEDLDQDTIIEYAESINTASGSASRLVEKLLAMTEPDMASIKNHTPSPQADAPNTDQAETQNKAA